MAWETETVRLLRHMIGDLSDTPKYTDDRLQEAVLVGAQLVKSEVDLAQDYVVDLDELLLIPDPTQYPARDDAFINLMVLKAACLFDNAEARQAAGQAIAIRDVGSSVELGNIATAKLAILKQGWCVNYEKTKFEYEAGNVSGAGAAILGPFRFGQSWYYSYPVDGRYR